MRRFGSRSEIFGRLTKLQWRFRYPRYESDCMTWSFPRQINFPPIRSPRDVKSSARSRSSPLPQRQGQGPRSSGRFRQSVTA
jgi:hypothetical protein